MWKDIKDYEGLYQISTDGKVRSITRIITNTFGSVYEIEGRELKYNLSPNGYQIVHLCKNGKRTAKYVHRLVAETFIPNLNNLPVVNHKNGNKLESNISNLEWVSYSQNNMHAYQTGLKGKGEKHYKAKLTKKEIQEIKRLGKYTTFQKIADKYGVTKATIRDVLLGNTWKDIS